jgi:hypothetical protein
LARFVVEVIDGLDLSTMVRSYRGRVKPWGEHQRFRNVALVSGEQL